MNPHMIHKKTLLPLIFSLLFLALMTAVTALVSQHTDGWESFLLNVLLMLAAIPCHILGKKVIALYWVSLIINAVGCGFGIAASYAALERAILLPELLFGLIPACLLLLLTAGIQGTVKTRGRLVNGLLYGLNILLLIGAIYVLFAIHGNVGAYAAFCLTVTLFFLWIFGTAPGQPAVKILRNVSFGGFGIGFVIAFIAIFILSEGDALDGLDLGLLPDASVKKKKR